MINNTKKITKGEAYMSFHTKQHLSLNSEVVLEPTLHSLEERRLSFKRFDRKMWVMIGYGIFFNVIFIWAYLPSSKHYFITLS